MARSRAPGFAGKVLRPVLEPSDLMNAHNLRLKGHCDAICSDAVTVAKSSLSIHNT